MRQYRTGFGACLHTPLLEKGAREQRGTCRHVVRRDSPAHECHVGVHDAPCDAVVRLVLRAHVHPHRLCAARA